MLTKWVAPDVRFIPNFKGRGYGYFHASPEHLIGIVNKQEDAEVRAGIWITLWEIFLRGQLDPPLLLEKILTAVKEEKDPLLLEYLTDKINRIYWQFLTPGQRSLVSKDLDETLFELMALEKDNSRKRTIFNCYRSVANSPKGVLNLIKFWSDEISLGLEVSERDHIQLAYALAIREAEGHEKILAAQLNKVTNPDRKSEMQFVLQALSPDPVVRDRFFESLAKKENRTREPWVLEAVRYLHHPLRAEYSKRYLKTSLQMLEEVQSTGDIFFPKGWLDATLGDYQSASAADVVRGYLNENAGLRPDLRNKLLQSADMLFRAELITKKNLAASPN